jgi:hypothetical protein
MFGHKTDMPRCIADNGHFIATGARSLHQDQRVVDGPGRTDSFLGLEAVERIQGQRLPRTGEGVINPSMGKHDENDTEKEDSWAPQNQAALRTKEWGS